MTPFAKRSFALLAQFALVAIAIGTLTFLLWEPHVEGRNVHATTFEIYFKDPFLAYVYLGSTPFFVALYRAFKLFDPVRKHGTFGTTAVRTLQTIKTCAIILIAFVVGAVGFILRFGDGEDRPAGIAMSFMVAVAAGAIALAAATAARKLQKS